MISLSQLRKMLSEMDGDREVTIHDLVRENLRPEPSSGEYHLASISEVETNETQVKYPAVSSPVHENFAYAEKRLGELMNENEIKAREALKAIESLDCSGNVRWTDAVETDLPEK